MLSRPVILAFMAGVIIWGGLSISQIDFDADTVDYSVATEQDIAHYNAINSHFTSYPKSTIVILDKKDKWLTYEDYLLLDSIRLFSQTLPEVTGVSSLTDITFPKKGPFGISRKKLISLKSLTEFDHWQSQKLDFPDITDKFISANEQYALLYISSPEGLTSGSINALKKHNLLTKASVQPLIVQDNLTKAIIQSDFKEESLILGLICALFVFLTFYLFTRSLRGLGLIAFFIAFNLTATALFMHFAGISFNIHMVALPCLLMIFSFTDIMHIIYHQTLLKSKTADDLAMRAALKRKLGIPILLTSVSNLFSFIIYLLLSDNESLFNLAVISLVGVSIAYLSVRFLAIPLLTRKQFYIAPSKIDRVQGFNTNAKIKPTVALAFLSLTAVILLGLNVFNFKVDTGKSQDYSANKELNQSQQILTNHFYGSKSIEILIWENKPGAIWDPGNLEIMEQIEQELTKVIDPVYVLSPVTLVKRYHRYTANGDPRAYKLPKRIGPKTRDALNALYEELGGGEIIAHDFSKARILLGYKNEGLYQSLSKYTELENCLNDLNYPDLNFELTGLNVLTDRGIYAFTLKIIWGWAIAMLLSACLIMIILKSFVRGLVFLFVNLVPLLLVLLLMPLLNLNINPQSLFLLTILVGLCLDDSIYLLVQRKKSDKQVALFPILVTSCVLAAGFIAFGFSSFAWLSPFAWIFLIGIVAALLLDLFILPLFTIANKDFE